MNNKILDDIKSDILPILQRSEIKKAAFFGSYVRGDNTEKSDIDILVEFPRGKSLFDLVGLKIDLEKKLKKKVDVITYRSICPYLKKSIMGNQYPIL